MSVLARQKGVGGFLPSASRLGASLVALASLSVSWGEEAATAPPKPEAVDPDVRELWVPADQLSAVLARFPRAVLIEPEAYRRLIEDASAPEAGEVEPPPLSAAILEAALTGKVGRDVVSLEAVYRVRSFEDGWAALPLHLPREQLAGLEVDGEGAVRLLDEEKHKDKQAKKSAGSDRPLQLWLRGEGLHEVRARFHLPVERNAEGNRVSLTSPGLAAARMELEVEPGIELESDLPFRIATDDRGTRAHFVLPAGGGTHELRWEARDVAAIEGSAILQTCRYLYSVDATRVQADLALVLDAPLRELPQQLFIRVPEGLRVLSVEGTELLAWTREGDRIEVRLVPGKRRTADLRLLAERAIALEGEEGAEGEAKASVAEVQVSLPVPEVEGVHRASGTMALLGSDATRIKGLQVGGLAVPAGEMLEPAIREHPHFVAGFRFPVLFEPPRLTLAKTQQRFKVQLDTAIDLRRDAVYLNRDLAVIPLEGETFGVSVELPEAEEIVDVRWSEDEVRQNEPDWTRTPNGLRLQWREGLRVGEALGLRIETRRDPTGWFELGADPLALDFVSAAVPGAEAVSGYLAASFDPSFKVETQDETGLESRDARTAPITGKLAWFRLEDYGLELAVQRRPPEVNAAITAYALPRLSTLEVEGEVRLLVRHTPLAEIELALDPVIADRLRLDSPLIAEKRLEADSGTWTFTLHEERSGPLRFRFSLSLPLEIADANADENEAAGDADNEATDGSEGKRFRVVVPSLSLPQATRLQGQWLIEANTDTELAMETTNLDAVDLLNARGVAGYTPRHRVIAAYNYRDEAHTLVIDGVRHEPEELVATVIDRLEIDSVLSVDGLDRHQVQLDLRSAGDQFLDVSLPDEAELWTLTVNGDPAKPVDAGDGGLRIQLPTGGEGRVSAAIRLIYQTRRGAWRGSGEGRLQPVGLSESIPVLRTAWRLHLPEGYDYQSFETRLQRRFEIEDRTLLGRVLEEGSQWFDGFADAKYAMAVDAAAVDAAGSEGLSDSEGERLDAVMFDSIRNGWGQDEELSRKQRGMSVDHSSPGPPEAPVAMSAQIVEEALVEREELAKAEPAPMPTARPESALADNLVTRAFKVPPTFMAQPGGMAGGGGGAVDPFAAGPVEPRGGTAAARTAREQLEQAGISFGNGAEARYDSASGQLIVRNTPDQLDLVDAYTQPLSASDGTVALGAGGEILVSGGAGAVGMSAGDAVSVNGRISHGGVVSISGGVNGGLVVVDDQRMSGLALLPEDRALLSVVGPAEGAAQATSSIGRVVDAGTLEAERQRIDQLRRTLDSTVLPTVSFENIPYGEAIDSLQRQVNDLAEADQRAVEFRYGTTDPRLGGQQAANAPDSDGLASADTPVTLQLNNVPATEALRYLNGLANTNYQVTASGVVIAPGPATELELVTLVEEVAPERLVGPGGQLMTARQYLQAAGVRFPSGSAAAYNPSTRRLAVRNTPDQLERVVAVLRLGRGDTGDRGELVQGLIPIDFTLPTAGRLYRFEALQGPDPIAFRYVAWERQVRFAWLWIVGGAFAYLMVARWRPWFGGLLGLLVLACLPRLTEPLFTTVTNAVLLGWLVAMALRVLARWVARGAGKGTEASGQEADGERREVVA